MDKSMHKLVDESTDLRVDKDETGFFIMEAMVALVILSIGLLGMLTALTTSSRHNYQSLLLSEALIYQYNLGSTLKANATAAAQGRYQFPMQSAEEVAETFGLSNTGSPARDITIWAQQIQRRFAGHSPYISSLCSAPPSRCILNLEWRDQTAARPFDQVDIDNESQVPKVRMTTAIALKDPAPRLVHPDKKPDTADHILAR